MNYSLSSVSTALDLLTSEDAGGHLLVSLLDDPDMNLALALFPASSLPNQLLEGGNQASKITGGGMRAADIEKLAKALIHLFVSAEFTNRIGSEKSGATLGVDRLLQLMERVVSMEVRDIRLSSFADLFRANCLATKVLSQYCNGIGTCWVALACLV
jgi:hypothetical protein